jgi:hypothetical protein
MLDQFGAELIEICGILGEIEMGSFGWFRSGEAHRDVKSM